MNYRPYIWMGGEDCDAHVRDFRRIEDGGSFLSCGYSPMNPFLARQMAQGEALSQLQFKPRSDYQQLLQQMNTGKPMKPSVIDAILSGAAMTWMGY